MPLRKTIYRQESLHDCSIVKILHILEKEGAILHLSTSNGQGNIFLRTIKNFLVRCLWYELVLHSYILIVLKAEIKCSFKKNSVR